MGDNLVYQRSMKTTIQPDLHVASKDMRDHRNGQSFRSPPGSTFASTVDVNCDVKAQEIGQNSGNRRQDPTYNTTHVVKGIIQNDPRSRPTNILSPRLELEGVGDEFRFGTG